MKTVLLAITAGFIGRARRTGRREEAVLRNVDMLVEWLPYCRKIGLRGLVGRQLCIVGSRCIQLRQLGRKRERSRAQGVK
jgi:hypothetical protein